MTRKDYVLIAQAFARAREDITRMGNAGLRTDNAQFGISTAVQAVSDALQSDNPRFDARRFREACEGE